MDSLERAKESTRAELEVWGPRRAARERRSRGFERKAAYKRERAPYFWIIDEFYEIVIGR